MEIKDFVLKKKKGEEEDPKFKIHLQIFWIAGNDHNLTTYFCLFKQRTSSSIMFTRLDAERNGKILKRAVNEKRLSDDSFSMIMEHMDNYVSLPAKRLSHIVRRYSHHRSMKDIGKYCMRNKQ